VSVPRQTWRSKASLRCSRASSVSRGLASTCWTLRSLVTTATQNAMGTSRMKLPKRM
jgi:hypothetical protein